MKRSLLIAAALVGAAACGSFGSEPDTPGALGDGGLDEGGAIGASSTSSGGTTYDGGTVVPDGAVTDAGPCAVCRSGACDENGCFPLVFVTKDTYPGDFAIGAKPRLQVADEICNKAGADPTRPKPGIFVAWLSTTTTSALSRVNKGGAGQRKVVDSSGAFIMQKYADIGAGLMLLHGIHLDEKGGTVDNEAVWTGTNANGEATPDTCNDWTDTTFSAYIGFSGNPNSWTQSAPTSCSYPAHLYCFEIVQ